MERFAHEMHEKTRKKIERQGDVSSWRSLVAMKERAHQDLTKFGKG